jgi:hypothetical protein
MMSPPATQAALRQRHMRNRANAREARRLAARAAHVTTWWASITAPKPQYLTPMSLELSLGKPLRRMAATLRLLGWRCLVRSVRGHQKTVWLPPSSALQPRPRGRPRVYAG